MNKMNTNQIAVKQTKQAGFYEEEQDNILIVGLERFCAFNGLDFLFSPWIVIGIEGSRVSDHRFLSTEIFASRSLFESEFGIDLQKRLLPICQKMDD
jgi:hypothetical protein